MQYTGYGLGFIFINVKKTERKKKTFRSFCLAHKLYLFRYTYVYRTSLIQTTSSIHDRYLKLKSTGTKSILVYIVYSVHFIDFMFKHVFFITGIHSIQFRLYHEGNICFCFKYSFSFQLNRSNEFFKKVNHNKLNHVLVRF